MKNEGQEFADLINRKIETLQFGLNPPELYEPIRYIMALGGKRLRPLLTLLSYSLYKDSPEEILNVALAVEVFHNFTLMHDDIMDKAPLRRGEPTVHKRWNDNIAILSGDVMMVKAYELLMQVPPEKLNTVLAAFNKCATEVCEGQQYDMNFETKTAVSEEEYLNMIRLKTAALLGLSMELGAIIGGADEQSCALLQEFGIMIGIGFQLKDDLLDVYADQGKFGKQVGGDIIVNKKTFLLIKALEKAQQPEKDKLEDWLTKEFFDKGEKVKQVVSIYNQLGMRDLTELKMNEYFNAGFASLDKLPLPENKKSSLRSFATDLIEREK